VKQRKGLSIYQTDLSFPERQMKLAPKKIGYKTLRHGDAVPEGDFRDSASSRTPNTKRRHILQRLRRPLLARRPR
jgi:hypothetical protein